MFTLSYHAIIISFCMGISLCPTPFFPRGTSFVTLFASLDEKALFKEGLLLKERICSCRSKFFLLRVDPYLDAKQKRKTKLLPHKSISIHLKTTVLIKLYCLDIIFCLECF